MTYAPFSSVDAVHEQLARDTQQWCEETAIGSPQAVKRGNQAEKPDPE